MRERLAGRLSTVLGRRAGRRSDVEGHLDSVSEEGLVGWAWIPNEPERVAEIEVHVDGLHVATLTASRPRKDVAAAGKRETSGFTWEFPAEFHDGRTHEIRLIEARSRALLPNGEARLFLPDPDAGKAPAAADLDGSLLHRLERLLGGAPPKASTLAPHRVDEALLRDLVAALGWTPAGARALRSFVRASPAELAQHLVGTGDFAASLQALAGRLDDDAEDAAARGTTDDALLDLFSPDAALYWHLRDAVATRRGDAQATREVLRFLYLCQLRRALLRQADLAETVATWIRAAADGDALATSLVAGAARSAGIGPKTLPAGAIGSLTEIAQRAVRHLVSTQSACRPLNAADRAALADLLALDPAALRPSRPVRLAGEASAQADAAAGRGKDAAATLHLVAGVKLSAVSLAALSCRADAALQGAHPLALHDVYPDWPEGPLSLHALTAPATLRVEAARGSGPARPSAHAEAGPHVLHGWLDPDSPEAPAEVALEEAFAFLVRMPGLADWPDVANLAGCRRFEDAEALLAVLEGASPEILSKPVLLLGDLTPRTPRLITDLVAAYWRHAGAEIVSAVAIDPGRDGTGVTVAPPDAARLSIFFAPAFCAIPAALASRVLAGGARSAIRPVMQLEGRPAVCLPLSGGDAWQAAADRLAAALQTGANAALLREVMQTGALTQRRLAAFRGVGHWPISGLVEREIAARRDLATALPALRDAAPRAGAVKAALHGIDTSDPRIWHHLGQIAELVEAAASDGAALDSFGGSDFEKLFRLSALTGQDARLRDRILTDIECLCAAHSSTILPIFEFLAGQLDPADISVALLRVASVQEKVDNRYFYRIAECCRRYGNAQTLHVLLGRVAERRPALLDERGFLKNFQRLRGTPYERAMRDGPMPELPSKLAAAQAPGDMLMEMLAAGDPDLLPQFFEIARRDDGFDAIGWLDRMRAFSNELEALDPPDAAGIHPPGGNLHLLRLASVVLRLRPTLTELCAEGMFDDGTELSAAAHNGAGDNGPANRILARGADVAGYRPFVLAGQSAREVFEGALDAASPPPAGADPGAGAGAPAASVKASDGPSGGPSGGPSRGAESRVSVIMTALNPRLDLLALALASVTRQEHANWELIVVDDGSDRQLRDEIGRMVGAIEGARFVSLERSFGPYHGRNVALEIATGAFVAIQDADDISHPARFRMQLDLLRAREQVMLSTTRHVRIDDHGRIQLEAGFRIFGDGPMTSMFRREVFAQAGGFAPVRSRGDVEMRERIASYYGAGAIHELPCVGMLCFAASSTLSQTVKTALGEHLQLWRTQVSNRPPLHNLREEGTPLPANLGVRIPRALEAARPLEIGT